MRLQTEELDLKTEFDAHPKSKMQWEERMMACVICHADLLIQSCGLSSTGNGLPFLSFLI